MTTPKRRSTTPQNASFSYSDFDTAKRRLLETIPKGAFYAVITGPSGSGKTSLLGEVTSSLDRHRFAVYYLAQSRLSTWGVARFLCEELHLTPRRSHTQTLSAMSEAIRELPFRVLLFVDEASLLSQETLEEIRLLAESELNAPPLFSVVFAGLPELKAKLESPALFPLRRRLSLRLELNGLRSEEVAPFLAHRLRQPEASRFSAESLAVLFERSRGIPAVLESLARLCLERAAEGQALDVDAVTDILDASDL